MTLVVMIMSTNAHQDVTEFDDEDDSGEDEEKEDDEDRQGIGHGFSPPVR